VMSHRRRMETHLHVVLWSNVWDAI